MGTIKNLKIMTCTCKYQNCKLDMSKKTNQLTDEAYQIFKTYLNDESLNFNNEKIIFDTKKNLFTFREQIFEHLVSQKINAIVRRHSDSYVRPYDKNRIVHLPYLKTILSNCCNESCEKLKIFKDYADICIWCEEIDYVIILNKVKNGYSLVTAYPVDHKFKRQSLEKKSQQKQLILSK